MKRKRNQKWKILHTGIRPATLLKKRLQNRYFPANLVKFLRTSFFIAASRSSNHRWLAYLRKIDNKNLISVIFAIGKSKLAPPNEKLLSIFISGLEKLCTLCRLGAIKTSGACPIFRARIFCLVKKKNLFDLQISSQIDKTIKRLEWIPNSIVNSSALVMFWCLHIWLCQNWLNLLMDWETFN